MEIYTDAEAKVGTEEIAKSGSTLLQIWRTDPDERVHVKSIINYAGINEFSCASAIDLGCGTGQFLYLLQLIYGDIPLVGYNKFRSQINMCRNPTLKLYEADIAKMRPESLAQIDEDPKVKCHLMFCNYTLGHLDDDGVKNVMRLFAESGAERLICYDIIPKDVYNDSIFGYKLRSGAELAHLAKEYGVRSHTMVLTHAQIYPVQEATIGVEDANAFRMLTIPALHTFRRPIFD